MRNEFELGLARDGGGSRYCGGRYGGLCRGRGRRGQTARLERFDVGADDTAVGAGSRDRMKVDAGLFRQAFGQRTGEQTLSVVALGSGSGRALASTWL